MLSVVIIIVFMGANRTLSRLWQVGLGVLPLALTLVSQGVEVEKDLGSNADGVASQPLQVPDSPSALEERDFAVPTGTVRARLVTWGALIDFSMTSFDQFALGSGPGAGYLIESGALSLLVGPEAANSTDILTRHAHNSILHTAAMLGVPAAVFLAGGSVLLVVAA